MKELFKRHPALETWLSSKTGLTCFFQQRDKKIMLTGYVSRSGRVFFIREYVDGGYDIFIEACLDNDIKKTFEIVDLYLAQ